MEEKHQSAGKAAKIVKIVVASIACLVLLLSLTVVMWWTIAGVKTWDEGVQLVVKLFTPRENDVYYKDSYTVKDDKAFKNKDKTVATVGTAALTNGQLQVYYWVNVYDNMDYAVYSGMDYTKPFNEQLCPDMEKGNWQQFFLEDALGTWHKYQAMALLAQQEGLELPEDLRKTLDNLRANMTETALSSGYSSLDALIQADMGGGCTFEDYQAYMETYCVGYAYFNDHYSKIEVTDQMLADYFAANEETLKKGGITKESGKYYDVRHILIEIAGGTKDENGKTVYSEEDWEACRVKAQKLLDEWLAGEHTEATFAELAQKHSADGGSKKEGGLYSRLTDKTNFVKPFKDWYLDEARVKGDYGLVKTHYGYHIMYFSSAQEQWSVECRDGILSDKAHEILSNAVEAFPLEVDYKKIMLGNVDLSK